MKGFFLQDTGLIDVIKSRGQYSKILESNYGVFIDEARKSDFCTDLGFRQILQGAGELTYWRYFRLSTVLC